MLATPKKSGGLDRRLPSLQPPQSNTRPLPEQAPLLGGEHSAGRPLPAALMSKQQRHERGLGTEGRPPWLQLPEVGWEAELIHRVFGNCRKYKKAIQIIMGHDDDRCLPCSPWELQSSRGGRHANIFITAQGWRTEIHLGRPISSKTANTNRKKWTVSSSVCLNLFLRKGSLLHFK